MGLNITANTVRNNSVFALKTTPTAGQMSLQVLAGAAQVAMELFIWPIDRLQIECYF
jgi:hypothetical protein